MMYSSDKSAIIDQLQSSLFAFCEPREDRVEVHNLLQTLSGILVETMLLFETPEEGLVCCLDNIAAQLNISTETLAEDAIFSPAPAFELDCHAEQGRLLVKEILEDWMECTHEFRKFIETFTIQNLLVWEDHGIERADLYAYLYNSSIRFMAYEIAAQELCEIVIDELIGGWGWTLLDNISGLSAVSGYKLAQSLDQEQCMIFQGADIPKHMDHIIHVMTQEAVRYGTPAGSDWKFGIAANDVPPNPPWEILCGVSPYADKILDCLPLPDLTDQAAACAKAAGRLIAVAAGGEEPEYEHFIVKPLALSAMGESYKSICSGLTLKQETI